jgi:DNA-binding SARP family transcriptional activator/tetratricopeptide (TPR) repeat protein
MPDLEIRLLGEPEVLNGEVRAELRAPRLAWSLIAMLVMRPRPLKRAVVAAALWPEKADSLALLTLRRFLHLVTVALPSSHQWIVSSAKSIEWNRTAPCRIDALEFEMAIAEGREADAVEHYTGDLLGTSGDEAIAEDRERLRSAYLAALANLTLRMRAERRFDAAARYAELILASDAWREDAVRAVMSALYQGGDRSGALLAYERFSTALDRELRVSPMRATIALRDTILSGLAIAEDFALPPDSLGANEPHVGGSSNGWNHALVGRCDELEMMRTTWSRAMRKSGGVLFLSGEAGVGKSRLAGELVGLVREWGGQVLVGSTSNPEGAPYQAVVTALRGGLSSIAVDEIAEPWVDALGAVLPELGIASQFSSPYEPSSDQGARERLLEGFVKLVERLCRVRPLCMVFEDLHWSGAATIDVVARLARRVGTLPVLILVTYRDRALGGELVRELRARLVGERRAHAMPIERLKPPDVSAMVRSAIGDEPLGATAEASILRLSEGNPLFVVQLLERYRETGELPSTSDALHTVGEEIAARTRRVTDGARTVAETAATLGETFSVDVVVAMTGWNDTTVLEAVEELIDRSLVRESGSGSLEYAFTHALVAASFYENSDSQSRIARHRRAAQIFSRSGKEHLSELAAIARHWHLAGDSDRASRAYVRVSRQALLAYARDEAIDYAAVAAEIARDDLTRFQALEAAGRAQIGKGNTVRWVDDLARLELVACNLGEQERFQALQLRCAFAFQVGDDDLARRCVDGMFAIAHQLQSDVLLLDAFISRGRLELAANDISGSIASFREALRRAAVLRDDELIVSARNQLISALGRHSALAEARVELDAQCAFMETQDPAKIPFLRVHLLSAEATLASVLEDGPQLERLGAETQTLARLVGDTYFEARGHTMLAHGASLRQDLDAMRLNYDQAAELFALTGARRAVLTTYVNRSKCEWRFGCAGESLRWLDLAIGDEEFFSNRNDIESILHISRSDALLDLGQAEEALIAARKGFELSAGTADSEPRFVVDTLTALGAAEMLNDQFDRALEHLTEAIARGREVGYSVEQALCRIIELHIRSNRASDASPSVCELSELFEKGAIQPARVCWTLATYYERTNNIAQHDAWVSRGAAFVRAVQSKFSSPADAEAYASLPHHRQLLEPGVRRTLFERQYL